jgi:hypothetical protein
MQLHMSAMFSQIYKFKPAESKGSSINAESSYSSLLCWLHDGAGRGTSEEQRFHEDTKASSSNLWYVPGGLLWRDTTNNIPDVSQSSKWKGENTYKVIKIPGENR